ncbi:putative toxin-antitoxin system, antitoxin component, ribbon-helix-helix domain protein [Lautropia mirabilis ATCC 51599]|jgi:putative yacA [plasmid colIb-P9]|uniref:Putative toxin-antitoxin system, antitoxin component, ribbon-helix-helix domain protein n=1 Tax=Lautropia mirabilis ATCC 51599 TaxID=887898 RepID=E7RTV5_9BURK|nr:putative toxin-antitoxin system, antitoxin component, ribbon-helix-helix domain protein [Lautropia mirabilis ATCC 51599]
MANMQERVRQQKAAEHDAWFRRQVQAGLDSANAGRLIPAVEVEARFAEKRAATAAGFSSLHPPDSRPRRYDQ